MIKKLVEFVTNPVCRFDALNRRGFYNSLCDEKYLKKRFKAYMGRKLDLKNPKSFNEKLQWLKLYDRKDIYTTMVDKYRVREYIKEKLGEEYLIPLLGVWDNPDDIDFDALPEKFVLKCNHNSGVGLYICRDKSKMDVENIKNKLRIGLSQDYYLRGREWPYKNVKRQVIAEQFMEDSVNKELIDYKFYCFNGEPKFLYISKGLEDHTTASISFLTLDWEFAPFSRSDYKGFTELPKKPENFEQMKGFAKKLSDGIDFLRVDLYEINGKIYFSELTFSPCSGFIPFVPEEWDYKLGKLINLSGESIVKE